MSNYFNGEITFTFKIIFISTECEFQYKKATRTRWQEYFQVSISERNVW